jgi:hypothetical protein
MRIEASAVRIKGHSLIAGQDMPESLHPPELRGDGEPGLPKRVDGVLQGWAG